MTNSLFLSDDMRPLSIYSDQLDALLAQLTEDVEAHSAVRICEALDRYVVCWARALPTTMDVELSMGDDNAPSSSVIRLAPALVLRRRRRNGLGKLAAAVAESLSHASQPADLPPGLLNLHELRRVMDAPEPPYPEPGDNHCIPCALPVNEAQHRALQHARNGQNLLIYGPPGTGKSCTIVNLVCDAVAAGKRVLVTSECADALRILHDLLPAAMRGLSVSWFGQEAADREALETCLDVMQEQVNAATAGYRFDSDRKATVERELAALRDAYADRLERDVAMDATEKADKVRRQRDKHAWLATLLADSQYDPRNIPPPLSDEAWSRLCSLLDDIDPKLEAELVLAIPSPDTLPAIADVIEADRRKQKAERDLQALKAPPDSALKEAAFSLAEADLEAATHHLDAVVDFVDTADGGPVWLADFWQDILRGKTLTWEAFRRQTAEVLGRLKSVLEPCDDQPAEDAPRWFEELSQQFDAVPLSGLPESVTWRNIDQLVHELKVMRRPMHLRFRRRTAWIKKLRMGGQSLTDERQVTETLKKLAWQVATDELGGRWSAKVAIELSSSTEVDWRETVVIWDRWLDECLEVAGHLRSVQQFLKTELPDLHPGKLWHDLQALLTYAKARTRYIQASRKLALLLERISTVLDEQLAGPEPTHPVVTGLSHAAHQMDAQHCAANMHALISLHSAKRQQAECEKLLKEMADALHTTADSIKASLRRCGSELITKPLSAAWEAVQLYESTLDALEPEYGRAFDKRLHELQAELSEHVNDQLSADAWSICRERVRARGSDYIPALRLSMSRLPQKDAKTYEAKARSLKSLLAQCHDLIPIWIMPADVAGDLFGDLGGIHYDLVVVDEASQSGPAAIALLALAPQIVVVGDEQQNAPVTVGVATGRVEELMGEHLPGEEAATWSILTPEHSLLDCFFLFGRDTVHLREYFRGPAGPIAFQNALFYRDVEGRSPRSLIPVKPPKVNQLQPIQTVFVQHGQVETASDGDLVNRPEAEAIIRQLEACWGDSSYAGMTFSVISLQGQGQAKLLEHMVQKAFDSAIIAERRLKVGIARAFQGEERDVILLSLVRAPRSSSGEHGYRSLEDASARQRFNVATSRHRRQYWLFHSILPAQLNPRDIRCRLLEFALRTSGSGATSTTAIPEPPSAVHLSRWRQLAGETDRTQSVPAGVAPFKSWFELDVFMALQDYGISAIPHYRHAGAATEYRMDLVIPGQIASVAVQCDGMHPAGTLRTVLDEQEQLERYGWVFHRIRAAAWYINPQQEVHALLTLLEELDIFPVGEDQHIDTVLSSDDCQDTMPEPPTPALLTSPLDTESTKQTLLTPQPQYSLTAAIETIGSKSTDRSHLLLATNNSTVAEEFEDVSSLEQALKSSSRSGRFHAVCSHLWACRKSIAAVINCICRHLTTEPDPLIRVVIVLALARCPTLPEGVRGLAEQAAHLDPSPEVREALFALLKRQLDHP